MNKLFLYSTVTLLTVVTATPGFAKSKDDKKKDKDKDKEKVRTVYVERDSQRYYEDREGRRYYVDREGRRHWVDDRNERDDRQQYYGDNRQQYYEDNRERTRSIYMIEQNRPVQRVVYIDSQGRYYRSIQGRRVYVQDRYFESYPSKYYYPDGRRRVTISLPF